MSDVRLPDGRRVIATHDWARDWWRVELEGDDGRVREGRWLLEVLLDLLDVPPEAKPDWFMPSLHRLAGHETPLGLRFRCRCCGYLTLERMDTYDICPVCGWEDDPTTIWSPGERGGPGPNGLSLTEARANFLRFANSKPGLNDDLRRDPLPAERP